MSIISLKKQSWCFQELLVIFSCTTGSWLTLFWPKTKQQIGYNGLINFECSFVAEECLLVLKPQPNSTYIDKVEVELFRMLTEFVDALKSFMHSSPLVMSQCGFEGAKFPGVVLLLCWIWSQLFSEYHIVEYSWWEKKHYEKSQYLMLFSFI